MQALFGEIYSPAARGGSVFFSSLAARCGGCMKKATKAPMRFL